VKNRCEKIQQRIGAWLDGELPPRKAGRIEKHVESCPICRAEAARLRALQNLLREGFSAAVSTQDGGLSSLHERIVGRIPDRRGGSGKAVERTKFQIPSFRFRPAALSFAVTVLIVSAVFFTIYKPAPTVIKTNSVNDCIVEDVESGSHTLLLFKTHGSAMTVIWVTGGQDV